MKDLVKQWLQHLGWYEPLRYSAAMRMYKTWTRHPEYLQHQKELAFYRSFLTGPHLIFDIGAHHGFKSAVFLEMGARVVACDPDGANISLMRRRFKGQGNNVLLLQEALGPEPGTASFLVHHPGSAFNTLSPVWKGLLESDRKNRWNEEVRFEGREVRVPVITLDQLIAEYGTPDFIKIDAEGYEEEIIKGLTRPVPCLSVESLWPEFIPSLRRIMEHLQGISAQWLFNICVDEKFVFSGFRELDEFDGWLKDSPVPHFEVVFQTKN